MLHTDSCTQRFIKAEMTCKTDLSPQVTCPRCMLNSASTDLLEACKVASSVYGRMICRTPTGDERNRLTEQNILRLAAIAKAEKGE